MKIMDNPKLFFWLSPLAVVSLYAPFLDNPALFDALSMLLHIAVGLVLFQFLSLLYREVLGADEYEKLTYGWSAGFAALLFALHPVSVYAVAYLVQRSILFATLFSLLALWSYLQGLIHANAKGWLFASVFCYTAAVFSKEHAIALPMVMLALTMLLRAPSRRLWKDLWWVYALCGLVSDRK